jgi:hypothetical protein
MLACQITIGWVDKESIMKILFCVLAVATLIFGQSAYNLKLWNFTVGSFAADSLKTSAAFPAGDGEGIDIIVKSPNKDSSVFLVGYQRGYWDGGQIIWKRPYTVIDTFNTLTAGNFKAAGALAYSAAGDTDVVQSIDSAQVSGFVIMERHFNAYRSPYARIVLKGLTGNKKTNYSTFITVSQPKYYRVDVGEGRQPN